MMTTGRIQYASAIAVMILLMSCVLISLYLHQVDPDVSLVGPYQMRNGYSIIPSNSNDIIPSHSTSDESIDFPGYTIVVPSHSKRKGSVESLLKHYRPRFEACYSIHEIVIIWIDDNEIPTHLQDFVGNDSQPLPINLRAVNATIPSRIVKVVSCQS